MMDSYERHKYEVAILKAAIKYGFPEHVLHINAATRRTLVDWLNERLTTCKDPAALAVDATAAALAQKYVEVTFGLDQTPQAGTEPAPAGSDGAEPASLKEVIDDAMEKHPARQGISRQAWGMIFAWCDKHEGLKVDPAAIAQLTSAEVNTVHKALQRYREDQNDCHKT